MDIRIDPRISYAEGRERFDPPQGIRHCTAVFEGVQRSWKEYIPDSYSSDTAVPLVVTLHGGRAGTGRCNHQAELSTAWALIARREGFIVLYPQSITPEESWTAWDDFATDPRTKPLQDDLRYLDWLLERVQNTYNIDPARIYLHGQSFGDVMASYYLVKRPHNPFAAAAVLSGPVGATRYFSPQGDCLFGPECALPVVRTHGSKDLAMPMGVYQHLGDTAPSYDHMAALRSDGADPGEIARQKLLMQVLPSNALWQSINQTQSEPLLSVRGRYNALTYPGRYDFHFYTVEGGGHGPTMDTYDYIWSSFFSGWRLVNGAPVKTAPAAPFTPDEDAVVLADNVSLAYVNNHKVPLQAAARIIGGAAYLPAACIPLVYPSLRLTLTDNDLSAEYSDGTNRLQLSASNRTYLWNNHLRHGPRTYRLDETLLVPVSTIAGCFYAQKEKHRDGVSYFSPMDGALTFDFCHIVKQLLGAAPQIPPALLYRMEADILAQAPQPAATL